MGEQTGIADEAYELLSRTPPFSGLPGPLRRSLASTARERAFGAGEAIVQEGSLGDEFYLVVSGSLHVIARAFDGTALVVARLERGQCFGEQSLIDGEDRLRKATVRAVAGGRLQAFPREALLRACRADETLRAHFHGVGRAQKELRGTSFREGILQDLGVGSRYGIVRFAAGEEVIREGERGESVYLILSGEARATRTVNGATVTFSDLRPGQFFGELAILTDRPRAASVHATTDLETACLDGAWFRATAASQPRLRSIMASLQAMYLLPSRGLLTLQSGTLGSQPTLTATHDLGDGRQVVSTRLTEFESFVARRVDAPEATAIAHFEDADRAVSRTMHLHGGRLVEVEAEGPWQNLGQAYALLLDDAAIAPADLAAFEAGGDFGPAPPPPSEAAEIVCRCSGVTAGKVSAAIADGCDTLKAVAARTAATLVCGGCAPTIREFLGEGGWQPVACEAASPLTEDVRAFRLRPLRPGAVAALPGQHVVLQARIRGCWVARPYTLAAPPAEDGTCEVIVKREPFGLLSRWLFDQTSSDPALRISQPGGDFHLDPRTGRDVVFLAGGVGITPGLAMARSLGAGSAGPRFLLHHSVSSEAAALCRDELERLAGALDRFDYVLRVTGREGRLDRDALAGLTARYAEAEFLLCGSEGYVDAVGAMLTGLAVPAGRVRAERFTSVG